MKTAIITGASSGLGREMARQIGDRFGGIREVWLIARREERLQELAEEMPVPVRIFPLDLTETAALEVLERELRERKPEVMFLVNASGYGKIGPVERLSLEEETGMVALNCQALCAVTRLVLPYMARKGRIIQFASAAAFLPQPDFAVYAATKSFVLSYSRALNSELKPREICVTAVCPGPVKTEFFDIAETTGSIPLYKRLVMAKPEKVAALALRDSMMGKTVSVYGPLMKAFWLISKILPHGLLLTVMEQL
ncbi:MAG TPA: SDR family NAD(P)-dependent oxidoreductase [Candidatus Lachnoclostridium stercorigallinarum]|uniref:SDR family NAD(P)-dependent oxidoreductase n=1 Tax=Candidatus Lachnoclostridium stercorigallinarum TaxID=2838634 RepID=A0A9D2GGD9_9FIRM|nr:SDR family NAD(P)-dependent oxidoreductase [Candidatus Lachnoclostridium stercorigallinarum]